MLPVAAGANVRYVVPNTCAPGRENVLFLRPLVVKNDARLEVRVGGQEIKIADARPRAAVGDDPAQPGEGRSAAGRRRSSAMRRPIRYGAVMEVSIR